MGSYSRNRYATESASFPKSASSAPGSYSYATFAELPSAGTTPGNTAFVVATNRLYIWSGVGWYLIATVTNASPTAISGVAGSYGLAIDGTATTITAVSTDPEGFALTWSFTVSAGSLGSIATVTQADNVFTITPSSVEANAGTFSLTFNVTDGVNGSVSTVSAFTLQFSVTNSKYTTLAVKATITGGSNNVFDDAAASNRTVTTVNDTMASTFSPHRHGGYSAHFDGAIDSLSIPTSADFALGTADFTVEFWVYQRQVKNYTIYFDYRTTNSENTLYLYQFATGVVDLHIGGVGHTFTPPSMLDKWSHIAIARSGNLTKLFVDGVQYLSFIDNTNYVQGAAFYISRYYLNTSYSINGYMRDFRWVKGTAVYTSAFTPPTEPLTAITNTKLLIGGGLPYFKDQSTSNHAISVMGDASLKALSLFDNSQYSEVSNGASAIFDGTNDGLTVPISADFAFEADYQVECWFYAKAHVSATYNSILGVNTSGNNDWGFYTQAGGTFFLYDPDVGGQKTYASAFSYNTWNFVSWSRRGGTANLHINGIRIDQYASSGTLPAAGPLWIGSDDPVANGDYNGYVSDVRIVKGSTIYTGSNYTPPTAPLTISLTYPSLAIGAANSGASAYTLSGDVTGNNAAVNMVIGQTVNFTVNASGHPFYIRVANAGVNVSTPAATGQGSTSGVVSWTPNAAGTYYYQCGNHAAMIGTIVVTDSTNDVKFLLNPETSISDLSQRNTFDCFGSATTSQTIVKYTGTKSIWIPNAGSYVRLVDAADSWVYPAASANYTIELWLNLTNVSNGTYQEFLTCGIGFQWYVDSSGDLRIAISGNNSGSYVWHPSPMHRLVSNTWHHLALVRQGLNYTVYVDGVSKGSTSNAPDTNTGTNVLEIGAYAGGQYTSVGYYQDVRITKGLARYTGNFTPPTSESQG